MVEQKGRILSSTRCCDDGTDAIGAKEETAPIRISATVVASIRGDMIVVIGMLLVWYRGIILIEWLLARLICSVSSS